MMQRPSSTRKNRPSSSGQRSVHSMGGRGLQLPSGRSSSLSRMSGASQGRYSEVPRAQTKDARPVTDKVYLHSCAERILKFMLDSGYNATNITARSLMNPSLKDFFVMFEFLFGLIRPPFSFTGKAEDEVPKLVKLLRYPFTINRSMLLGLGSRQTWGCLLGLLVWMIDLLEVLYEGNEHFNFLEEREGDEFGGTCYNELLFDGICERFREYEQTGRTDDANDVDMFQHCVETFMGPSKLQDFQLVNDKLREQIETLQIRKDELSERENKLKTVRLDIERLEQYLMNMDVYLANVQEDSKRIAQEVQKIEIEIEPLVAEKSKLKAVLSQQESEANQFKLTMAKRKAAEERFNRAVLLYSQLENALTDKEVRCCNAWHNLKKFIIQYEGIHQDIQTIVKQYEEKLATVVLPHLGNLPGTLKESMTVKEADQVLVQMQNLSRVLKDQMAEASKATVNSEGTLSELREYLKELRQKQNQIDSSIRGEKAKMRKNEEDFDLKMSEIGEAVRRLDCLEAERKNNVAKNLEVQRKYAQELELKLAESKRKAEDLEKECALVLQKAVDRIKKHNEETETIHTEFAKKLKSRIMQLMS